MGIDWLRPTAGALTGEPVAPREQLPGTYAQVLSVEFGEFSLDHVPQGRLSQQDREREVLRDRRTDTAIKLYEEGGEGRSADVTADANGKWTVTRNGLGVGAHPFSAISLAPTGSTVPADTVSVEVG